MGNYLPYIVLMLVYLEVMLLTFTISNQVKEKYSDSLLCGAGFTLLFLPTLGCLLALIK